MRSLPASVAAAVALVASGRQSCVSAKNVPRIASPSLVASAESVSTVSSRSSQEGEAEACNAISITSAIGSLYAAFSHFSVDCAICARIHANSNPTIRYPTPKESTPFPTEVPQGISVPRPLGSVHFWHANMKVPFRAFFQEGYGTHLKESRKGVASPCCCLALVSLVR